MIYVPTNHLKSGMVLAQNVNNGAAFLSLLVEGQTLNSSSILRLKRHNINGIYIQSRLTGDIDDNSLFDDVFRKETVTELKTIYDQHTGKKALSFVALKGFTKIAETLIDYALSKDECLINVIEVKEYDTYTYTHSMNVALLSVMMGIRLGYSRPILSELAMCGLLHDIGKTDISIDIINKPGALTPDEFETIKSHPHFAVNRLAEIGSYFPAVVLGIESHHERFNGTGYPKGLSGTKIPIYGRILALADVYDALTSGRIYRKAWASSDAIEYMMGEVQSHFDYDLLIVFLKTVAAYPIGTIVRLSNNYMGVVTGNCSDSYLRPKVKLFAPDEMVGVEVDLGNDRDFLNVTVIGTIADDDDLPDSIFVK